MKVFLSSTYIDLGEHRRLSAEAIERLGQQSRRMEVFGARPEEPRDACIREVDQCDIFVGMYAHRYGYVPNGSDASITELEFRHANATRKPILCFVIDEEHPWPPRMIEDDPGRAKLRQFKEFISKHVVRESFTTPPDLALKVATSLGRYLAEVSAPLYPVVSGLETLIKEKANAQDADRHATVEALSAAVEIANRTLQYIASQPTGEQSLTKKLTPDEEKARAKERAALAAGWNQAGLKLVQLKDPPRQLAERYFLKAEYWSYPEAWTDERIDSAQIRLDAIARESRELLLGLAENQPLASEQSNTAKQIEAAQAIASQFSVESMPLAEVLKNIHLTETQRKILRDLISPSGTKLSKSMMNLSLMYPKSEINELFHKSLITLIGTDVVVSHDMIASFFANDFYK